MRDIAFLGQMMSGKDTLASYFIKKQGYRRIAFADELKQEICDSLNPLKTNPNSPYLNIQYINENKSKYRALLQWWGTEFRRSDDPDYWVKKVNLIYKFYKKISYPVVITDARFVNEVEFLKTNRFLLVKVCPSDALISANFDKTAMTLAERDKALSHVSEREWEAILKPDLVVTNDIGYESAADAVMEVLNRLKVKKIDINNVNEHFKSILQ